MLLKQTLNKLIKIATISSKYSDDDLHLYKCSDEKWRAEITQKVSSDTSIKFNHFIIEITDEFPDIDATHIYLPFSLVRYMANTKKMDFDIGVVDSFMKTDNSEYDFNTYINLQYETVELDKGAYLEYSSEKFELNAEPTIFVNVTSRTPFIELAFVCDSEIGKEIAVLNHEDGKISTIGTITVL